MYRAVGLLLLIVLVIIFLIFFLLFKKGCFDNFLNRQSDPPVTVFATVIKITQDYSMSGSSFGRGDYSSGYVSGYTTDNIFFETESGERLSARTGGNGSGTASRRGCRAAQALLGA